MGFDNETITPHGFRGVASTFLNEQGFRTKVIEAQLSHKLTSDVEASYNHAQYLDERRDMLNQWGSYLEALKEGATVIPFKRKA
jgi:integrase